jgi:hypothetical protein
MSGSNSGICRAAAIAFAPRLGHDQDGVDPGLRACWPMPPPKRVSSPIMRLPRRALFSFPSRACRIKDVTLSPVGTLRCQPLLEQIPQLMREPHHRVLRVSRAASATLLMIASMP